MRGGDRGSLIYSRERIIKTPRSNHLIHAKSLEFPESPGSAQNSGAGLFRKTIVFVGSAYPQDGSTEAKNKLPPVSHSPDWLRRSCSETKSM
jgi:hypothetical protein